MGSGPRKPASTASLSAKPLGIAALVAALLSAPDPARADFACRDNAIWLRGDFGTARFSVDVADDPGERAQGLMFVEEMPASRGMLFVYDRPQSVAFWMKNTLIPLDIIFADATGTVRHIHPEAIPGDETALPGLSPDIQYVLEINGGMAADLGLAPGTELRHPAIESAAWPCD